MYGFFGVHVDYGAVEEAVRWMLVPRGLGGGQGGYPPQGGQREPPGEREPRERGERRAGKEDKGTRLRWV